MQKITPMRAKSAQRALLAMFFFQGVISTTQIPRVPELIKQIGVRFDQWGLIMGFAAIGSILGLATANRLIARFGAQRVSQVTAVILAAMITSFSFTTNPAVFFFENVIWAMSMSCFNVSINSQSVILQNALKRVIIGRFHGTWSIGAMISTAVAGYLATTATIQVHFVAVSLVCLFAFLVANHFMLGKSESHEAERTKKPARIAFFKTPAKVWLIAIGFYLAVAPELALIDWSAVFNRDALQISNASLASIPYTVFLVFMILGRLSIGRVTRRWHISQVARLGGFVAFAGLVTLVAFSDALTAVPVPERVALTSAILAVAGLGSATLVPSFLSSTGHIKGMDTATVLARASLVQTLLIIATKIGIGAIAENAGVRASFILPCALVLACAFVSTIFVRDARKNDIVADAFPVTIPIPLVSE